MVSPNGKDISRAQKIGGPIRENGVNCVLIIATIINIVGSYFVFHVKCDLTFKLFAILISCMSILMTFLSVEDENQDTEHPRPRDDGKIKNRFLHFFLLTPIVVVSAILLGYRYRKLNLAKRTKSRAL